MVEKGRIVNIQEQEEENELKVISHGVHEISSVENNVDKEKQAHDDWDGNWVFLYVLTCFNIRAVKLLEWL